MKTLTEHVEGFVEKLQTLYNDMFAKQYPNLSPPTIEVTWGKKYAKVVQTNDGGGHSVLAFIAVADGRTKGLGGFCQGDIFKPATWSAPARNVRGSVLSDGNGMEAVNASGFVHYMR
jgi:hypothetical protein